MPEGSITRQEKEQQLIATPTVNNLLELIEEAIPKKKKKIKRFRLRSKKSHLKKSHSRKFRLRLRSKESSRALRS